MFSIRIQWRSHQSLSENRKFFDQNPMKIPSEPIRKQKIFRSESNEDSIRAYIRKREDLPVIFQKPWGMVQISSLLLRIYPPSKKKRKKQNLGGAFTIVDVTLPVVPRKAVAEVSE